MKAVSLGSSLRCKCWLLRVGAGVGCCLGWVVAAPPPGSHTHCPQLHTLPLPRSLPQFPPQQNGDDDSHFLKRPSQRTHEASSKSLLM